MSVLSTVLQFAGIVAVVVAVAMLATVGWTVLAGGVAALVVGLALERED